MRTPAMQSKLVFQPGKKNLNEQTCNIRLWTVEWTTFKKILVYFWLEEKKKKEKKK